MGNQLSIMAANQLVVRKQELTTSSIAYFKTLANWSSNELAAYEAKNTGLQFVNLNEKQQLVSLSTMILEISVISGCPIPSNQVQFKMFESELMKYFKENESFANLTFDEVITAFRFNTLDKFWEKVKHWQNPINLEYIGEVLTNWLAYSSKIRIKAENDLERMFLFDLSEKEGLTDNEIVLQAKTIYINTADYMQIEVRVFDILKGSSAINLTDEEKNRITQEATYKTNWFTRYHNQIYFNTEYSTIQSRVSKKIATAEYFKKLENLTADEYEINVEREIREKTIAIANRKMVM